MSHPSLEVPVGQLAARRPEALRILEQHRIDYCCGGDQSLDSACRDAGINPQIVLDEIARAQPADDEPRRDWLTASLTQLCDHIERTHHAFLRDQLPFLTGLIDKVVAAHEQGHPELRDVRVVFAELRNLMDMCVVAALIEKEDLAGLAGLDGFPVLAGARGGVGPEKGRVPQAISTKCSYLKIGRNYVITASGGVQIESWEVASKSKVDANVKRVHSKAAPPAGSTRWWN